MHGNQALNVSLRALRQRFPFPSQMSYHSPVSSYQHGTPPTYQGTSNPAGNMLPTMVSSTRVANPFPAYEH